MSDINFTDKLAAYERDIAKLSGQHSPRQLDTGGIVNMRETLKSLVRKLQAVEALEYEDKNLLSGDNQTRCEWKMRTLDSIMDILERFTIENLGKENRKP
jgi:hypothetical protein